MLFESELMVRQHRRATSISIVHLSVLLDLDGELEQRIVMVAGRLAAIDDRYADWAAEVGVPVGSVQSEGEKAELVAELDALVAHLYGLDVSDLETIWDTFHTTVDHLPDLGKVVGYFEEWSR